jgi:hypothetical protein
VLEESAESSRFDEYLSTPKFVDQLSESDDDSGEEYQLTQWFPSDFAATSQQQQQPQRAEPEHQQHQQRDEQQQQHEWILNNPFVGKDVTFNDVIVTDVTVNDLTVTMRESHRPEGFFKHPIG